jgi:hypothetical protein
MKEKMIIALGVQMAQFPVFKTPAHSQIYMEFEDAQVAELFGEFWKRAGASVFLQFVAFTYQQKHPSRAVSSRVTPARPSSVQPAGGVDRLLPAGPSGNDAAPVDYLDV